MTSLAKPMRFASNMYQTVSEQTLGGPSEAETTGTQ